MDLRVSSNLASFGGAVQVNLRVSPSSSLFQQRLLMRFRVSPNPASQRPCPRWSFELPRSSHPSERPAPKPRGPSSSSRPSRCGCGLPRTLHLRVLPATEFRVSSSLESISASGGEDQVAPLLTRSVAPPDASARLPRLPHLPALPAMDLRVASNFASFSASGCSSLGLPPQLGSSRCT